MAILIHPLGRRSAVGAVLAGLTLLGCAAVAFFGGRDTTPRFSHRVHVIDQGLDCAMCHMTEEGDSRPLPVDLAQCALCHDSLDEEQPEHKRAAAFFVVDPAAGPDAAPTPRRVLPRFKDEVIFDHTSHAALLGDNCLACHVGMDESDGLDADDALTMASCVKCHEAEGRQDTCAVCHTEVDIHWRPGTHGAPGAPTGPGNAWMRLHGEFSRDPHPPTESDCALCHTQSSCTECHQTMQPASHDEHFRLRGHGILADLDRESCFVCHRADSCNACHQTARPISHHGAFGSPVNHHCVGCHLPLAGEGCYTCHKDTPSHRLAAPQPPDHVPGANCRLCHGVGAPLPHVDDGSNCAACHR